MDPTLASNMMQFIGLSSCLVKRALSERDKALTKSAASTEKQSATKDFLLEKKVISVDQVKRAQDILADHDKTLDFVQQLSKTAADQAAKIAELTTALTKRAGSLGSSVAGAGSLTDPAAALAATLRNPVVGGRTSEKKASDLAYEQALFGT